MKILLFDDNLSLIKIFSNFTEREAHQEKEEIEVTVCSSVDQLVSYLENCNFDFIFFNAKAPTIKNYKIFELLNSNTCKSVLVTPNNFDLNNSTSNIPQSFWRMEKVGPSELVAPNDHIENKKLSLKFAGNIFSILLNDIYYLESNKHQIILYTKKDAIKYRENISILSEKLEPFFSRCHVGFLVNCRHITSIHQKDLTLDNNKTIPISRNRRQLFLEQFDHYCTVMKIL